MNNYQLSIINYQLSIITLAPVNEVTLPRSSAVGFHPVRVKRCFIGDSYIVTGARYSPQVRRSVWQISPVVAYDSTADKM